MGFAVRLYKSTGFNSCNLPDGPGLLDQYQYVDSTTNIEWMQDRFLTEVSIQVSGWETVEDVDYVRVNNYYYFVTGITMTSTDVAKFSLAIDAFTTIKGVAGLYIMDGITERVHVTDDTYGKYAGDDSLLTPAEPLQVQCEWQNKNDAGVVCVESTVNPVTTHVNRDAIEFTPNYNGNNTITATAVKVSVPAAKPVRNKSVFILPDKSSGNDRGTGLFAVGKDDGVSININESFMQECLSDLRSLGLEQAIVAQVHYPTAMVQLALWPGEGGLTNEHVKTAKGKTGNVACSHFPYVMYPNVKNNLINYSNYTKYGLATCAGNECEFDPADIVEPNTSYPSVTFKADPHPEGKPYYRFKTVKGDSSSGGFWRNCIAGMPWRQVPLVFSLQSGSELTTMRFNASQTMAALGEDQRIAQFNLSQGRSIGEMVAGAGNAFGGMFSNPSASQMKAGQTGPVMGSGLNIAQGLSNAFQSVAFGVYDYQTNNIMNQYAQAKYAADRKMELAEIAIAQRCVVPTVMFPYNSEILREEFGNGVLVYRYKYSDNDVARIDKLLTMYGYKFCKPLEKSDFSNRQKFNFIKCSNVTIAGHPKWLNDLVSEQLRNGVRIWHVKPDPVHYTNNPINPVA